jgi:hypothetical protein
MLISGNDWTSIFPASSGRRSRCAAHWAGILVSMLLAGSFCGRCAANPFWNTDDPRRATTSKEAQQSAIRSIPLEQLDPAARAKVESVLSNVTIFRRMPVRVIDCDPNLYLFLAHHPDVMVNIWEVLKLSRLQATELDANTYQISEPSGTVGTIQYLHRSFDTQVVYCTGTYRGPLFGQPVKGRALLLLKTGYVRETDGRYYITNRLDSFLSVDDAGMDLLARTLQPVLGKTADNNFIESVAFVGSLSRTAEVNSRGVQRLSTRLARVQPQNREKLAALAAQIAADAQAQTGSQPSPPANVVSNRIAAPDNLGNDGGRKANATSGATPAPAMRR